MNSKNQRMHFFAISNFSVVFQWFFILLFAADVMTDNELGLMSPITEALLLPLLLLLVTSSKLHCES